MSGAAIVVENLTKTYRGGSVRALDGVSLEVRRGEVLGIIGPNGAGKTTLMGCLLGFLHPESGTVAVEGRSPDDLSIRAVTGYLPERLMFDRWMPGRQFLRPPHALARLDPGERERETGGLLDRVGLDAEAADKTVKKYSRGMLQRLGLAQALLGGPRLLYLDEPTSGMDPVGASMVRELLGAIRATGSTIVLNSHQLDQVERVCDRVAFVRAGRVEAVEVTEAGAAARRRIMVRIGQGRSGRAPSRAGLAAIAKRAGAVLVDVSEREARFEVADDEGAAKLLALLVRARVKVVEATAEEGRLERLFFERGPRGR